MRRGVVSARCGPADSPDVRGNRTSLRVSRLSAEQSNTSIVYGDRLILKLFRRLQTGHQPGFRDRPAAHRDGRLHPGAGRRRRARVHRDRGSGRRRWRCCSNWSKARETDGSTRPTRSIASSTASRRRPDACHRHATAHAAAVRPIARWAGTSPTAETLGRRTGEMHLALASDSSRDPAFAPEPFTQADLSTVVDDTLAQAAARPAGARAPARRTAATLFRQRSGRRAERLLQSRDTLARTDSFRAHARVRRRRRSACTATTTSDRCCGARETSTSSTSRGSPRARSSSAGRSSRRSRTSPAWCGRSATRPTPACSRTRRPGPANSSGSSRGHASGKRRRRPRSCAATSTRPPARSSFPAEASQRDGAAAALRARQGAVRAELRTEQSSRLGAHSAAGHLRHPERREAT